MLTFDEAKQIALAKIGVECSLIEDEIIEKPYGWYFMYQSNAYLKSGDDRHMLIGSAGFIVEREAGRVFEFGSAYPPERWLANYEKGFKYIRYDLTVVSVKNEQATIDYLNRLEMSYIIPELKHGTVWKIPQKFTRKQIAARLFELPCVFLNQGFWHKVEVFDQINASGCCAYKLSEHKPRKGEKTLGEILSSVPPD